MSDRPHEQPAHPNDIEVDVIPEVIEDDDDQFEDDDDLGEDEEVFVDEVPAGAVVVHQEQGKKAVDSTAIWRKYRDILADQQTGKLGKASRLVAVSLRPEHRRGTFIRLGLVAIALFALSRIDTSSAEIPGMFDGARTAEVSPTQGVTGTDPLFTGVAESVGGVPPQVIQSGEFDANGVRHHIVQQGENLYRIGLRYGLTAEQIAQANGIADPNFILINQDLIIPAVPGVAAEAPVDVQTNASVNTLAVGQPKPETVGVLEPVSPAELGTIRPSDGRYCVNQGDTLWGLGQRFGVTPEQLAAWNGIDMNDPSGFKMGTWIIVTAPQG